MLNLFFAVTMKLLTALAMGVAVVAAAIVALWAWNAASPKSFERVLRKAARYFK